MGIKSKFVTLIASMIGVGVFSQAPEFTQQYKQRLGGAVNELGIIVSDFDENAHSAELTRQEALQKLIGSSEEFVQNRGQSMQNTIGRFKRLENQKSEMENANSFIQPYLLAKNPDLELVEGTWSIYKPAVPITSEGGAYGGIGGLLGFLLARFLMLFGRKKHKLDAKSRAKQAASDKVLVEQIHASRRNEAGEQLADVDAQPLLRSQNAHEGNASKAPPSSGFDDLPERIDDLPERIDDLPERVHFRQIMHGEIDIHGKVVKISEPAKVKQAPKIIE